MSIGDVLSELLKKYNLNALELERLTGVPSSTIYRLLKDKSGNPTIEVLKKLSSFFQVTVSQLIGEDPIGCKQIPLIQPPEIHSFLNSPQDRKFEVDSIPIDLPLSSKCFATLSQDNMMEPFILVNSMVIVDPEREITNKDFVLLIKNKNEKPIIRQIISDEDDFYLKILNSNFPVELKKINLKDYLFVGVIVHYRTNLFDFGLPTSNRNHDDLIYDSKA
ncbi:XRE family transcriptional regulator [Legionella pneumophila serogroup 1]|uniref:XRE family transcriptional regulator n=1 Tax=Fluoribacter dumoffii TaxID=463 RepID=UPI002243FA68|nr:XRE family transcriptional regulator [Fluoribacter dumoffii]MCW8385503.1 XRE family transcriptional regulator [Fluoribacter dumoffii]MCW8496201.1 XRE family transcriptional regulator [Fluoribacter dumoffii]